MRSYLSPTLCQSHNLAYFLLTENARQPGRIANRNRVWQFSEGCVTVLLQR